jgi:hypothetical protein
MCVLLISPRSMCVTVHGVLDNWILVTGFIDLLQDVITNNYNIIANFHIFQITAAHAVFSSLNCLH